MTLNEAANEIKQNGVKVSRQKWQRGVYIIADSNDRIKIHNLGAYWQPTLDDLVASDWGVYVPHVGEV